MKQQELFKSQEEISDITIGRHEDPKALLRFAAESSGRPLKAIADDTGMDDKQLIRCLSHNPNETRHFPFEHLIQFMDAIDNDIPLRWLALKRGFGLVRLKSAVELENEQLRLKLAEKERDLAVIMNFVKEVKS